MLMQTDIDRIHADRMALHDAARQYMSGEITWEEWDAARDKYGPDYAAAFRHLDEVARKARREVERAEQHARYRRSFWRGVASLFRW